MSVFPFYSVHCKFDGLSNKSDLCCEEAVNIIGRMKNLKLGTLTGYHDAPCTNAKSENQLNAIMFARGTSLYYCVTVWLVMV
jgi:hypothetical protein